MVPMTGSLHFNKAFTEHIFNRSQPDKSHLTGFHIISTWQTGYPPQSWKVKENEMMPKVHVCANASYDKLLEGKYSILLSQIPCWGHCFEQFEKPKWNS